MSKIGKILDAIEYSLLPLTKKGIARGNHVFGAVVIDADTLETVAVGTNNRVMNPIYHGEIDTLQRFFALSGCPAPRKCIFVASHDPCPMCISAIAWAGFREIWVLYEYDDVQNNFDMPVDLAMYKEIFGAEGASKENKFYKKYSIEKEAAKEPDAWKLLERIERLKAAYMELEVSDFEYPGICRS